MVTVVDWPTGVPSCVVPLSVSGGPIDARYSFATDSRVAPVERPMFSWAPRVFSVEIAAMTATQFSLFETWFSVTLAQGANLFRFGHPITGEMMVWRIVKNDPPYTARKNRKDPRGDRRVVSVMFSIMQSPVEP